MLRRLLRQHRFEIEVGIRIQRANPDHVAQQRAIPPHHRQPLHGGTVADGKHRFAVVQPEFQRFGPKQHRQRHRHRAHLQHRHVGDSRLEALRHHNRHPVTSLHAQCRQRIGKAVGALLQLGIGKQAGGSLPGHAGAHGDPVCGVRLRGPARATRLGNIEVLRDLPAKSSVHGRIVVQRRHRRWLVMELTAWHGKSPYHGACPYFRRVTPCPFTLSLACPEPVEGSKGGRT